MGNERQSRFAANIKECSDWTAVTKAFDQLPKPVLRRDEFGEAYPEGWVYRGHESQNYILEPSIEREVQLDEWVEMEHRALLEFQSKAQMYMEPSQLPPLDCKLSWLSIMQHLGAPTRFLDFTYSPYVALYFALRHRKKDSEPYAEVWGIDASAVCGQAKKVHMAADKKVVANKKVCKQKDPSSQGIRLNPETFRSVFQSTRQEEEFRATAIRNALTPCGVRREEFNCSGLVDLALPPVQNLRLSSQQGVFLFNGAEDLSFEESLGVMMGGAVGDQWYRRIRIPENELHAIEEQLFQLNIHDLSLFPDAEGLTGFVRQRMRLHWA